MPIPQPIRSAPRHRACLPPNFGRLRLAGALAAAFGASCFAGTAWGQLTLSGTSYSQNFDGIGTALPAGWKVWTGATGTTLGNVANLTTVPTDWAATSGAFYNYAAADGINPNTGLTVTGSETGAVQATVIDRALGIRQTTTNGDIGEAFTLQIANTVDLSNFSLSFQAQMLSVQPRITTWTLQYATGATPTSFTTLATYSDPSAFGSSPINASLPDAAVANSTSSLWIRIVCLTPSTGTGARDSFGIDDFGLTYTRAPVALDYWDTNGATANIGGSGTWDAVSTGQPWNPNLAGDGTPASYDPNHLAVFGGTGGAVTVSGTVTTNRGLQFDSNNYQLNGGTITLAGVIPTIAVTNAGQTATINSTLAGTLGMTKNGPGTLVLTGTNSYTGGTTINDGTVSIAADANLGDSSGGVTFGGGTLKTTASLTLAATRALTGTGKVDVAPATTLQIAGSVTGLDLTLPNTGAVQFTGTSPILAGLTLQNAVSVSTTGGTLGIAGNLTTHHTTGTMTFTDNLNFGSVTSAIRLISVDNGSAAVDLRIAGNVTLAGGVGARITKLGAGTLELAGTANSISGFIRQGESGVTAIDGGTLRIASATALGGAPFQANAGTLVVLNDMTGTNAPAVGVGIQIGSNDTTPLTITGADIAFPGDSSLFNGGTTAYQNKLIVNNNVTLSGRLVAISGAILPTLGLTVAGTGSLTLSNATNAYNAPLTIDGATFVMNGAFTATTFKPVTTLQNNATLRGTGTLANVTALSGTIAPGNLSGQLTGTLTANDVDLRSDSTYSIDLRSKNTVGGILQYDRTVANTLLALDNPALTGSILASADIAVGDLFFILINGSADATFGTFFGLADNLVTPAQKTFLGPGGSVTFEIGYHGDSVGGIFDASGTGGNDVVLRALVAVPEPGSLSFLASGLAGLLGLGRWRRKPGVR